jgi:hypothetical protein
MRALRILVEIDGIDAVGSRSILEPFDPGRIRFARANGHQLLQGRLHCSQFLPQGAQPLPVVQHHHHVQGHPNLPPSSGADMLLTTLHPRHAPSG